METNSALTQNNETFTKHGDGEHGSIGEYTGVVVHFDNKKGYGWIQPDDEWLRGEVKRRGKTHVWVHFSAIHMQGFRTLKARQRVTFIAKQGAKGVFAHAVRTVVSG